VSTIQRDSSVRYVISSDQALTTPLTSALKAAGISGIKVAGSNIEASDENLIKSGQEPVGIPTELNMVAWMIVDAALRHAEGMTIPSETIRWTLLTSSSAITPSNIFAYPPNWQQQFKTLWKVG
jgi:ribose transport system substrate-binding protein